MEHDAALVVVTPWYPSETAVFAGIFVLEWTRALGHSPRHTVIVHVESVPLDRSAGASWEESELGRVLRIRVPVDPHAARFDVMNAHRKAISEHAKEVLAAAEVVIAHVGVPTGVGVPSFLRDDAVLITVEHATYLGVALRDPRVEAAYGAMMARSRRHLMVGEFGASRLRTLMPKVADRILAVGNPVDDTRLALTPPRTGLDRWLYVGNLNARKGVHNVVLAFELFARERPAARLTIIGRGPEQAAIEALTRSLDIGTSVEFREPVPIDVLPAIFADHDVLVHLSEYETFGLTIVEASITGLPVVVRESDGPLEALDVAASTGAIEFVDGVKASHVVGAVEALEARLPHANREHARGDLVRRFGRSGFGARLTAVIDGQAWWEQRDVPHVIVVASTGAGTRAVAGPVREARRLGRPTSVATTDTSYDLGLERAVPVVRIAEGALVAMGRAVNRTLTRTLPKFALLAGRRVLTYVERVPVLTRGARQAQRAVTAALRWLDAGRLRPGPVRVSRTPAPQRGARLAAAITASLPVPVSPDVLLVPCDDHAADACAALAQTYGASVVSNPGPGGISAHVHGDG